VLHYFGEFSDLESVKEHLALVRGMEQKEAELVGVSRALDDGMVSFSSIWTY